MVDQTLEDYELRVQEARLKLAWFDEEFRELQLLPDVSEYIRLSNIKLIYLTPEEHARREELAKTPDGVQFLRNENNTMYTNRELSHALSDLIKYQRNNKTPRQGSTDKWRNLDDAASSDGELCRLFLFWVLLPTMYCVCN